MQHWALHKVRMANSTLNYNIFLFILAQYLNFPLVPNVTFIYIHI